MSLCGAPSPDLGLVLGLTSTVDCNVQGLTQSAYGLLSAPGSPVIGLLTSFLTLYVAFIGYRLILGRGGLMVGDLALSAVKIGLVLALAVNWPIYQTVIFDTLFRGPEQLASMLTGAGRIASSALGASPLEGLQIAYDEMGRSATAMASHASAAAGTPDAAATAAGLGGGAPGAQAAANFAVFGLNGAAFLILLSTLGTILVAKVALALLLALGPVVAGFLLFDATRGFVEGWLKAMIAFALAPLLCTFVLMAELAALEPFLIQLIDMRNGARFSNAPANAVILLTLVFAGVIVAGGIGIAVIAAGLKLPRLGQGVARSDARAAAGAEGAAASIDMPSRAFAVARATSAMERRDGRAASAAVERRISLAGAERGPTPGFAGAAAPLGRSYRRTNQPRRSGAGVRRDR